MVNVYVYTLVMETTLVHPDSDLEFETAPASISIPLLDGTPKSGSELTFSGPAERSKPLEDELYVF